MNTGKISATRGIRLLCTLLLFAFLLSNCQDAPLEVPTKEEFTKAKLEAFGKMLSNEVLANYEFLPEMAPYDTSVYWYVQTIYTQATSVMKRDKQSPVENRWNQDRNWKVYIINDDEMRHAFVLPGGDLYISTGMLKSFEREHELYYLITFEAALMHEGLLLNRLIEEYNSLTINNLIEGRATGNDITLTDVAAELPALQFDGSSVMLADEETVSSICATSILESTGINPSLLDPEFQDCEWLNTRPSYTGRTANIVNLAEANGADCGHSIGSGNYQRFVLNILD